METLGELEANEEGDVVQVAVPVLVAEVDFDAEVVLDSVGLGVVVFVVETDTEEDPDGVPDRVEDFEGREDSVGTDVLLDDGDTADVNVDVVVGVFLFVPVFVMVLVVVRVFDAETDAVLVIVLDLEDEELANAVTDPLVVIVDDLEGDTVRVDVTEDVEVMETRDDAVPRGEEEEEGVEDVDLDDEGDLVDVFDSGADFVLVGVLKDDGVTNADRLAVLVDDTLAVTVVVREEV